MSGGRGRLDILNSICEHIGCKRDNPKTPEASKKELLFIESFVLLAHEDVRRKLEKIGVTDPRLRKMR